MHCLEYHFVLSLPKQIVWAPCGSNFIQALIYTVLYLRVKAQYYFVRLSYMVLDKETVIKIWLNLGLSHQSINHLF